MNKNQILANLKRSSLIAILPILVVACDNNKNNIDVDAELAKVDARIANTQSTLDSLRGIAVVITADSISRDPKIQEIVADIKKYEKTMKQLKAPADSTKIKRCKRKLSALRIDSIVHVNHIKEQIDNANIDAYRAVYNKQSALQAKRDSLMKLKTR